MREAFINYIKANAVVSYNNVKAVISWPYMVITNVREIQDTETIWDNGDTVWDYVPPARRTFWDIEL